jgi:hypothetical protein
VWAQVPHGPAAGLWLRVDPRTGALFFRGEGELAALPLAGERAV